MTPISAVDSGFGDFSSIFGLFGSLVSIMFLPFFLIGLGFVFYYFTGDKKKADDFIPNLMSQGMRLFSYTWLLLIAFVGFLSLNMMFGSVLSVILPSAEPTYSFMEEDNDFDSKSFVQGIALLIISIATAAGTILLQRKSLEISKIGATISAKIFYVSGMVIFSLVAFFSTVGTVMNIIEYLYENSYGIDSSAVSVMISSIVLFGLFVSKGFETLRKESK